MLDTRIFPPEYRGPYPHMFPRDIEIWERFLDKHGSIYDGFQYDVICGKSYKQFPRWEPEYQKDAEVLSRLRIDALGFQPEQLHIIEVKPRLNPASLGQIMVYREHFLTDYKPSLPVRMVIVAGEGDKNVEDLASKQGIIFVKV